MAIVEQECDTYEFLKSQALRIAEAVNFSLASE